MSLEVELNGQSYRIDKLDAIRQWHIFRRLVPVLSAFSGLTNVDEKLARAGFLDAFNPMMEKLSKMSDADTDYVINTCMMAVLRKDPTPGSVGWSRVMTKPGLLQFDDIDFITMLNLTKYVIMENLSSFFTRNASEDSAEAGVGQPPSPQ